MNYYEKAVRAIGACKTGTDVMDLLVEISAKSPKAVADAWERLHPPPKDYEVEINYDIAKSLARMGEKIKAIKLVRQLSKNSSGELMGLREAKDLVDSW